LSSITLIDEPTRTSVRPVSCSSVSQTRWIREGSDSSSLRRNGELVDDDDGVLSSQRFKQRFPVATNVTQRGELRGGGVDELFELIRGRGFDRLIVDGVVPVGDGLADEFALSQTTTAVDHNEVCRLGLVAVRQLIEFDVPISEVRHRSSTVFTQIELTILEIVFSELVVSYSEPD
jgi:hypothetical protein